MSLIAVIIFNLLQVSVARVLAEPIPLSHEWRRIELPTYYIESYQIIEYKGYTVAYDETSRLPRWVAYELTDEEANAKIAQRKGKSFRPDGIIQAVQAAQTDYRRSGWSHGHMAPAGDFKWDEEAMWETFFYTNCCPQDERLNNGSWNVLENCVREWAKQFGRVYVVTGPIIGKNRFGTIGKHRIVVPDAFFKSILVKTAEGYQGIAFTMQNNPDSQRPEDCLMSINDLEELTGIDFFPMLDDSIEEKVEEQIQPRFWGLLSR